MSNEANPVWAIIKRAREMKAKTDADPSGVCHTEGTALYNALWEADMPAAYAIRDGDRDPFRKPENIDRFLTYLCEYFKDSR
jgi:hypothetical protein